MTIPDMSVHRGPTGGAPAEPPPGGDPARADYPGLLAQVPAILYIADTGANGRWHYVSPQIEAILGFSPEEWCAQPRRWAEQLHPNDVERVIAEEIEVSGDEHEENSTAEYRLCHRDGRVVWIRDDAQLVIAGDGSRRWHGVLSDISDRKHAEAELERRAAQQTAVATLGEHALEGASPSELCQEAIEAGIRLLGVEIGAVIELLDDGEAFCFRAARGLGDAVTQILVPAGSSPRRATRSSTGRPSTSPTGTSRIASSALPSSPRRGRSAA